ncbi:MAG: MarR family transcriptional regulator [Bacteroidales bacterium]
MHHEKQLLNESLGYLTGVSHYKLRQKMAAKFLESGLDVTPDQWKVMMSLANKGQMYQSQLADCHKKDRAGIKRLVDHLDAKGLVSRTPSETDSRTILVSLTDKGHKTVLALNAMAKESMTEALAGFTESEVVLLKRLLTQLIENLSEGRNGG